jgi:hypothetical protein
MNLTLTNLNFIGTDEYNYIFIGDVEPINIFNYIVGDISPTNILGWRFQNQRI